MHSCEFEWWWWTCFRTIKHQTDTGFCLWRFCAIRRAFWIDADDLALTLMTTSSVWEYLHVAIWPWNHLLGGHFTCARQQFTLVSIRFLGSPNDVWPLEILNGIFWKMSRWVIQIHGWPCLAVDSWRGALWYNLLARQKRMQVPESPILLGDPSFYTNCCCSKSQWLTVIPLKYQTRRHASIDFRATVAVCQTHLIWIRNDTDVTIICSKSKYDAFLVSHTKSFEKKVVSSRWTRSNVRKAAYKQMF